jgi:hypothetical protein
MTIFVVIITKTKIAQGHIRDKWQPRSLLYKYKASNKSTRKCFYNYYSNRQVTNIKTVLTSLLLVDHWQNLVTGPWLIGKGDWKIQFLSSAQWSQLKFVDSITKEEEEDGY